MNFWLFEAMGLKICSIPRVLNQMLFNFSEVKTIAITFQGVKFEVRISTDQNSPPLFKYDFQGIPPFQM